MAAGEGYRGRRDRALCDGARSSLVDTGAGAGARFPDMSRTDHRRHLRPDGMRYGASTPRLTPPGWTTPYPSRVPPNAGGPGKVIWSAADGRRDAATMKRHGRRVERQRGRRSVRDEVAAL